jgi:Raf kinase inhibitor-like YbhB/YbcL family protein
MLTEVLMKVWSETFSSGSALPKQHAKGGGDLSPEMKWSEVPSGTIELALIMEQATTRLGERSFAHWVVYGIPPDPGGLPGDLGHEGTPGGAAGLRQGRNGLGNIGYDGPYGTISRKLSLRFRLFALDVHLELPEGASREELLKAMAGHVLAEADLDAEYVRSGEGRR